MRGQIQERYQKIAATDLSQQSFGEGSRSNTPKDGPRIVFDDSILRHLSPSKLCSLARIAKRYPVDLNAFPAKSYLVFSANVYESGTDWGRDSVSLMCQLRYKDELGKECNSSPECFFSNHGDLSVTQALEKYMAELTGTID